MAEPQKMVHLSPAQNRRKKFSHPLTDGAAEPLPNVVLTLLLDVYFVTRDVEAGEALIVNYFRLLRSTIAKYLFHWPVSRRFLDEMVSAGAEAITQVIHDLQPGQLVKETNSLSVGSLIERAIRRAVETTINDLRGVIPASERTNRGREAKQENPIYGTVNVDLASSNVYDSQVYLDIGSFIFELQDALAKLAPSGASRQIFAQENWGLSNAELGQKLNLTPRWVRFIRTKLRKEYLNLGERHV